MSPVRKKKHTRRTQQRLQTYAHTMGYQTCGHHRDYVLMQHRETGNEVSIPSTYDTSTPPTQMSPKVWHEVFKSLILGATKDG